MNDLIWKSQKEMDDEMTKRIFERTADQSRDGYVEAANGVFEYKGIKYFIRVLNYFNDRDGFTTLGRDRISSMHAVCEYPDETKEVVTLVTEIGDFDEFLYHDTLHTFNDKQDINEQIKEMHEAAEKDILKDIPAKIDEKIARLEELKKLILTKVI